MTHPLSFLFLSFRFFHEAMSIGIQQFFQIGNLLAQLPAYVGICHEHASVRHFHNLCGALDVGASQDGILCTGEGFVLYQLESAGVINQGVSGNTRLVVVCF